MAPLDEQVKSREKLSGCSLPLGIGKLPRATTRDLGSVEELFMR